MHMAARIHADSCGGERVCVYRSFAVTLSALLWYIVRVQSVVIGSYSGGGGFWTQAPGRAAN